MMKKWARSFRSSLGALAIMIAPPAFAQQNLGGNVVQDRQGGTTGGQAREGSSGAQTAQVGAGTTSGTTTGSSGPKDTASGGGGQTELPPLPSAELCDAYKDTPAYQSCLWVTLRD